MFNTVQFYYFSPTGGTKACGECFCKAIANNVNAINLGLEDAAFNGDCDLAVFAMPVFAGRIPAVAAEKLSALNGNGTKAVTLVVYGVRAYEDALLELNNVVKESNFTVVASAALVAQHSIVPAVGQGRPNEEDKASIAVFPEGYIHGDNLLHPFRSGVFKIAQKANVPIVVCTMQNTQKVKKNMPHLKPTDVHLHLVGILSPEDCQSMTTVDIGNRVHQMMAEDLGPDLVLQETP